MKKNSNICSHITLQGQSNVQFLTLLLLVSQIEIHRITTTSLHLELTKGLNQQFGLVLLKQGRDGVINISTEQVYLNCDNQTKQVKYLLSKIFQNFRL